MASLDRSPGLPRLSADTVAAAAPELQVLTPERVALGYDIAGIGSRAAALLVDVAVQGGLLGLLFAAFVGAIAAGDLARQVVRALGTVLPGPWVGIILFALVVLGLFLVTWGYYLLFEIVWNGQTPGKRLVGIRVIRDNGYPIRAREAVVRNLVRLVDGLPAGYVVGLLVMLLNRRAKRLGDFAAGTIVVHEGTRRPRTLSGLAQQRIEAEAAPIARVALSAAEATLVRDFLVRRGTMDVGPRAALAGRLAGTLARRYGLQGEQGVRGDEPFLEWLAP